jgi:myo-inositol-1(or 4)-monophosphatase
VPTAEQRLADELGRLSVQLATGAAEVVRNTAAGTVDAKSTITDLVTATDRASEEWLVRQLRAVRPDDAVLGEESGAREGTTAVRWLIDPVDGTVNFVLGLPQYAVSVAAELDGRTLVGAVCNPATGELFSARRGQGAFLGETRLTGPRSVPLERAVIATGFGYSPAVRARQAQVVARMLPRIADIRRFGSASLDLCAVAAGRIDAYFEAGLNPWDWAAGALIAAEAGCVTTGPDGTGPSPRITFAAGPALADPLHQLLDDLGADAVLDG